MEWNVETHIDLARGPISCDHALAHLRCGLVGEGDGEHLTDADVASGEQVGDAPGQHRRLARPRARDDQQRRAFVQHGLTLLLVEPLEELVSFGGHRHIGLKPTARNSGQQRQRADDQFFAQTRHLVAHLIRAQSAGTIFLRVPASGARGLAASPEPRGPLPDPGLVSCVRPVPDETAKTHPNRSPS